MADQFLMLFVPGHKLDWIAKAPKYGLDAVVIDLEDAVPTADKAAAREITRTGIAKLAAAGVGAFVRINALDQGGLDDTLAIATPGLAGIMLPKSRTPEEVRALDNRLSFGEGKAGLEYGSVSILVLPETPEGLADARALAQASARVKGVVGVIGGPVGGDVARAVGFRPTIEGSGAALPRLEAGARQQSRRRPPPDGQHNRHKDRGLDAIRRLVGRAKALGYSGAVLIHPSHVAIANELFTPTKEEIEYYSGLVAAFQAAEQSGSAAVRYKGAMVDYAMRLYAEVSLEKESGAAFLAFEPPSSCRRSLEERCQRAATGGGQHVTMTIRAGCRCQHHRPLKVGVRFSAKAFVPSCIFQRLQEAEHHLLQTQAGGQIHVAAAHREFLGAFHGNRCIPCDALRGCHGGVEQGSARNNLVDQPPARCRFCVDRVAGQQ